MQLLPQLREIPEGASRRATRQPHFRTRAPLQQGRPTALSAKAIQAEWENLSILRFSRSGDFDAVENSLRTLPLKKKNAIVGHWRLLTAWHIDSWFRPTLSEREIKLGVELVARRGVTNFDLSRTIAENKRWTLLHLCRFWSFL